jgi:thiamine kinase
MLPREAAAAALGIPEAYIDEVTLLKGGLTNHSWLVKVAAGTVVVRINNPHARALHVDREMEAEVLRVVSSAAIGPDVLLCDPHRHVLVTRYLGPACTPEDLRQPERIERIAKVLRRLHSILPPRRVAHVGWQASIGDYAATLTALNRETELLDRDVRTRMQALAAQLEQGATLRLCHNDVHSLNLVDNGEMRLLDWEYAGLGEPYFDLASLAFYNEFDLAQRALLLRAYEGTADARVMERLAMACVVFEYVHDLWHEVRRALESGDEVRRSS